MGLNIDPNITRPDDLYALLLSYHAGLGDDESQHFNARLIFILMNHVGDVETIRAALDLARSE
jgi:hypothetical protein